MKISERATGRHRKMDRISWREVLEAVATVEMDLRRLHTSEQLATGADLHGTVKVRFVRDREQTELLAVFPDPAVDAIGPRVAELVVAAPFKPSPTAMEIEIDCSFVSESASGGWDPGGDSDPGWGGGPAGGGREFGDPF
jgi:hypothetical protein